jgi:Spy/CpxP family protein refolding chaperone
MLRVMVLVLAFSVCAPAQLPRGFYAWWSRPEITRNLNLTPAQRQQIRATVQQYRPHLLNVRSEVLRAEQDLTQEFNRSPVNPAKADEAIARLVDARSDLTRTLSELSLKLRLLLSDQQWQELQRRLPTPGGGTPEPSEPPEQK